MPGTPATHILLAGSLASLLWVLILFNEAKACSDDLDLLSTPGSPSSLQECWNDSNWTKKRVKWLGGNSKYIYTCVYVGFFFLLTVPPELSELPPRAPALASLLWTGILFTVTGETHRELSVMKLCVAGQRKDRHLLYVWELRDRRRTCAAWKVRKGLGLYSRVGIWTVSQFAFWFEELLAQTSLAVLIMFHQT